MRSLVPTAAALALALAVAGCGGARVAPVSGVVKLDGRPYKNAVVSFQPIGTKDNPDAGRGSAGVTDGEGRYTLTYDGRRPGAVVGKHRVRIFTKFQSGPADGSSDTAPPGQRELIPAEWHEESKKEFTVPVGGTDAADFDIETRRARAD